MRKKIYLSLLIPLFTIIIKADTKKDPYLWLEDIEGKKSLEWVKKNNSKTIDILEQVPGFKQLNKNILNIYNAKDNIPFASKKGKYLYNFWQDDKHIRGIYRRTTMKEYKKKNPRWEIILDIDKLAKREKMNWVFKGMSLLYPDYKRGLLSLSDGGTDTKVIREFDLSKKEFIKNGFQLPEAKSAASWKDKDNLYVGTDFGKGSLTKSGYPRIVKLWKRGTPLSNAKTIYEGKKTSMSAVGARFFSESGHIDIVIDNLTFYKRKKFILINDKLIKLPIPLDVPWITVHKKQLIFRIMSDYKVKSKTHIKGTLLAIKLKDLLNGKKKYKVIMKPESKISISSIRTTKNHILVTVIDNVISRLFKYTLDKSGNWKKNEIFIQDNGTFHVFNTDEKNDDFFVSFENFLTAYSLYNVSAESGKKEFLKSQPIRFDPSPYEIEQKFATSNDGTKIPYFIIGKKEMKLNGNNPTLLNGYGGFMVSVRPYYDSIMGKAWLDRGGVYVLANIRGGGEYGPEWHQAALKKNRIKAYQDFIAVAEDIIEKKISNPKKLGIMGASNGGLLVGATFVMRPDLFNAVICDVPLLDMKRYTKLLAGASWIAEYGDPDKPDMWNYIKKYSPYHNVKKGTRYPEVFFTTSTKDDRVHPGHARKMAAKMINQGHNVFYYENIEGGHGGAANKKQYAYMRALKFSYLYLKLMGIGK